MNGPPQRSEPRATAGRIGRVTVALVALVVTGWAVVCQFRADGVRARHANLNLEMTRQEVGAVMGDPVVPSTDPDGRADWYYPDGHWNFMWSRVYIVRFTPQGRVSALDVDNYL